MYRVLPLLNASEIEECRRIAAASPFAEGSITNPHNKAKQNEQLHDAAAYQQSSQMLLQAFSRSEEFVEFAFPAMIAPPMITRYRPGMKYGAHADAAFIQLPGGSLRSDLSCTVFLNAPDSYEGGELNIRLGDSNLKFKLRAGEAIIYPSDSLHQVDPVTKGERLVAITFIQSRIADPFKRYMLFELNEVAALEGRKMDNDNFQRMQLVQQNLLRMWSAD
ncbi:MAG: Fe2+-dependent dioxygenase [Sphingomicrobium sp.]|jgi:PKHD-type hydroxylase